MKPQIFQHLQISYHYSDFLGNYAHALQYIEDQYFKNKPADSNTFITGWIGKVIIHLLQGELYEAARDLQALEPFTLQDPVVQVFHTTYQLWLQHERYNTWIDGAGNGAIEINAHWKGLEDIRPLAQLWFEQKSQITDPSMTFSVWYIYDFLCSVKSLLATVDKNDQTPIPISQNPIVQQHLATTKQLIHQLYQLKDWSWVTYIHCQVATMCRRAKDLDAGWAEIQKAFQTAQASNDPCTLAMVQMRQADWQCASFSTPISWNFALQDSSTENSNLPNAVEQIEAIPPNQETIQQCRHTYEQILLTFEAANAPRGVGAAVLRLGYLAAVEGDFQQAANYAQLAADAFKEGGDHRAYYLAQTHFLMANLMRGIGATTTIAAEIGKWGSTSGSFSFTLGLGVLVNRLGRHLLLRKGDFEKAIIVYNAAKILFENLGAMVNVAQSHADSAYLYYLLADANTAIAAFHKAIGAYEKVIETYPSEKIGGLEIILNLRMRLLTLISTLNNLNITIRNSDGLEKVALQLEKHKNSLPSTRGYEEILQGMQAQVMALVSGQPAPSAHDYETEFSVWSHREMATSSIQQARFLAHSYRSRKARRKGDLPKAELHWQQAFRALQNIPLSERYLLEAQLWMEKDDTSKAIAAGLLHWSENKTSKSASAKIMDTLGKFGQIRQSNQIRNQSAQALAFWVQLRQYEKAKFYFDKLQSLDAEWWKKNDLPWSDLTYCGQLFAGLDQHEEALIWLDQAIHFLESRRNLLKTDQSKIAISGSISAMKNYFQAASSALKLHQKERSFLYIEKGRARGLLDLMAGSHKRSSKTNQENKLLLQWQQLKAQISLHTNLLIKQKEENKTRNDNPIIHQLNATITQEEKTLAVLEKQLKEKHPNIAILLNEVGAVLNVTEVAKLLPSTALLITYFWYKDHLLIHAISREGLRRAEDIEIDHYKEEQQIFQFQKDCSKKRPFADLASKISERLLSPIADLLPQFQHLIFVPHDAMHLLPFQVLPFEGEPLANQFRITYLPSASILQFLPPSSLDHTNSMLAVGNPTGDLTFASVEATLVAKIFNTTALINEAATEEAVKEKIHQVALLHFATHGRLEEDTPLESSLLLANGEELSLYEIMGIQLNADLVVLSACNTGRGKTTAGGDILGLARGMLAGGAKAVIVSLWEVDDLSTTLFMGKFYECLKAGHPAEVALQAAQNYLRQLSGEALEAAEKALEQELAQTTAKDIVKKTRRLRSNRSLDETNGGMNAVGYDHPFYWAPFFLVGAVG